MDQYDEVMT